MPSRLAFWTRILAILLIGVCVVSFLWLLHEMELALSSIPLLFCSANESERTSLTRTAISTWFSNSLPRPSLNVDISRVIALSKIVLRHAFLGTILFGVFVVEPVAAQQSPVCNTNKLPSMIEGFFRLSTGLGIIGLAVMWQADSLIELFTFNPEQKKGIKRHKRSALKSAVILVALGPLYTVAGSMMGLPLAQCVNLIPW